MEPARDSVFDANTVRAAIEAITLRWSSWDDCKKQFKDWHTLKGYKLTRENVLRLRAAWRNLQ